MMKNIFIRNLVALMFINYTYAMQLTETQKMMLNVVINNQVLPKLHDTTKAKALSPTLITSSSCDILKAEKTAKKLHAFDHYVPQEILMGGKPKEFDQLGTGLLTNRKEEDSESSSSSSKDFSSALSMTAPPKLPLLKINKNYKAMETVLSLIKNKADLNKMYDLPGFRLHQTPLRAMIMHKRNKIVLMLLQSGANPNLRYEYEIVSPLSLSIGYENYEATDLLLKHGANPDGDINEMSTPLQHALKAENPSLSLILVLLESGANPNLIERLDDKRQRTYARFGIPSFIPSTPLGEAIKKNLSPGILDLLLMHGSDPMLKDLTGKTAVDYANEINPKHDLFSYMRINKIDIIDRLKFVIPGNSTELTSSYLW